MGELPQCGDALASDVVEHFFTFPGGVGDWRLDMDCRRGGRGRGGAGGGRGRLQEAAEEAGHHVVHAAVGHLAQVAVEVLAERGRVADDLVRGEIGDELFPVEQARIVRMLVERVEVGPAGADIRLRVEGLAGLVRDLGANGPEAVEAA